MQSDALKTVLLVDDEDLFRSSVAEALSAPRGPFAVLTAADGAQALEILRRQDVDLLITDLHMPVLDGIELLREFMGLQPGRPALVLTAHGSPEIEEHLRLLGGVSYLEKPIDLGMLHQRIDEALRPRTQGHIEGITLFGFLQLLEIERKSCTLTLRLGERRAVLFIRAGELIHAESDGLVGDAAVLQLGDWEAPEIDIENVCRTRKRTVETRLTELLMEAARLADERREYGPRDEAPPRTTTEDDDDLSTQFHAATAPHNERPEGIMASLKETLTKLTEIDGFMGACIVDSTSGMMLGAEGGGAGLNLEIAAAGNTEVVRAKRKTMASLGLRDAIEDILITLGKQYHLIRPLGVKDGMFAYLVLDKGRSNLAMARHSLADAEKGLAL
jgi:DNA-binding response OmpR family regulator